MRRSQLGVADQFAHHAVGVPSNRLAPALGTSPVLALEFAVLPLAVA